MNDDRPFIIVDNQKILPIPQVIKPNSAINERRSASHDGHVNVVDRVTLSAEAKAKSKQLQLALESESSDPVPSTYLKLPPFLPRKRH